MEVGRTLKSDLLLFEMGLFTLHNFCVSVIKKSSSLTVVFLLNPFMGLTV